MVFLLSVIALLQFFIERQDGLFKVRASGPNFVEIGANALPAFLAFPAIMLGVKGTVSGVIRAFAHN